jgi:hypothetical protein
MHRADSLFRFYVNVDRGQLYIECGIAKKKKDVKKPRLL